VIEDFENEVTPILAARLAETMLNCAFRLHTAASHTLQAQLDRRDLDLAICAAGPTPPAGASTFPLLEDPYILAVPRGTSVAGGIPALEGLTFLRRDPDQVMGRQIDQALARSGLTLPLRFEIDSNQSISALVASGRGWTITTPLSLLRAGRFAGEIDAHPLPFAGFARRIVLYAGAGWSGAVPGQIADLARGLVAEHFVTPGLEAMPWLGGRFRVLNQDG